MEFNQRLHCNIIISICLALLAPIASTWLCHFLLLINLDVFFSILMLSVRYSDLLFTAIFVPLHS